jgi:hypothetical protein
MKCPHCASLRSNARSDKMLEEENISQFYHVSFCHLFWLTVLAGDAVEVYFSELRRSDVPACWLPQLSCGKQRVNEQERFFCQVSRLGSLPRTPPASGCLDPVVHSKTLTYAMSLLAILSRAHVQLIVRA